MITSLLDTDLYKFSTSQLAFSQFPQAQALYEFINRDKREFPKGFSDKLQKEINNIGDLSFQDDEIEYLNNLGYFTEDYLEFLRKFRLNPRQVAISQEGHELFAFPIGDWYSSTLWEVPLMATVSELYFEDKPYNLQKTLQKVVDKSNYLYDKGVTWSDFGTRRRFSFELHNKIIELIHEAERFAGTSNVYLAKKYGIPCKGTMPHELIMAMQSLVGPQGCNQQAMACWLEQFQGKLNYYLPDTVTSEYFFNSCSRLDACIFQGLRQDSGNPDAFIQRAIEFYEELDIDPKTQTIICSDGLTDIKLAIIHELWNDKINIVGGIGTYLTNDVEGCKPLNIVIKLREAKLLNTWCPVVKLSDDEGKASGDETAVEYARSVCY